MMEKILEGAIANSLLKATENERTLFDIQFGFGKGRIFNAIQVVMDIAAIKFKVVTLDMKDAFNLINQKVADQDEYTALPQKQWLNMTPIKAQITVACQQAKQRNQR